MPEDALNSSTGIANATPAPASLQQQQIQFESASPGTALDMPTSEVTSFDTSAISGLELGDFWKRPVLISTTDWVEGNALSVNIDPWSLFFTEPAIKRKIENYGLLRANLRVKIIVSASPFFYSYFLASYDPMPTYHPAISGSSNMFRITHSQKPHIYGDVSSSTGGEMSLPFFYPENWVGNSVFPIERLGRLRLNSLVALRNANGVAGGNVTVKIYAWAENLELAAPTVNLQGSMDDYGISPISTIASAVANLGHKMSDVPIIGPFARATAMGAGAVSNVAAWFGYTNVPVLADVMPFKDLPFHGFASSEISAPTPKLTLDPKNELSIDSRTVGLDGTDELALSNFVGRESFLYDVQWDSSDLPEDTLAFVAIKPALFAGRVDNRLWPTPLSHACSMYQYWSGSIVFRIRVICTPYHRGYLKVMWDPSPHVNVVLNPMNETTNITKVYDITQCQDIEFRVPYMQGKAFLRNPALAIANGVPYGATVADITAGPGEEFNGQLQVTVANELTSPTSTAPVTLAIFVRAGDDFKLMGPIAPPSLAQWEVQGDVTTIDDLGDTTSTAEKLHLVYGGETALSLRQLMHRHCFTRSYALPLGATADEIALFRSQFYMYPLSEQFDSDVRGIHTTVGATPMNFVHNSFVSWISPCFAGRRGSMYWGVNSNTDGSNLLVDFVRRPIADGAIKIMTPAGYNEVDSVVRATSSKLSRDSYSHRNVGGAGSGIALYNDKTQTGATVLVPFISDQRFVNTHPSPWLAGTTIVRDHINELSVGYDALVSSTGAKEVMGDFFCASGPDFTPFFFVGIPVIELKASVPIA